jgi:hypothetical protein
MSLVVPLLGAAGAYLVYKVLKTRTDRAADALHQKDESHHDDSTQCPNAFGRYISVADALSDKTAWEWNPTVAEAHRTADSRVRVDLMSRHGRAVSGMVGMD